MRTKMGELFGAWIREVLCLWLCVCVQQLLVCILRGGALEELPRRGRGVWEVGGVMRDGRRRQ